MARRGFSLIEIAIVLAVIGLVIGGIYVAASAVRDNSRKQTALTQLLVIVQNMRQSFSTQALNGDPTIATLQALNVIPGDVSVVGGQLQGVYGMILISDNSASSGAATMNVGLYNLPANACASVATTVSASVATAGGQGICGMDINQTGAFFINVALTAAQAATFCNQSLNRIDICYYLH